MLCVDHGLGGRRGVGKRERQVRVKRRQHVPSVYVMVGCHKWKTPTLVACRPAGPLTVLSSKKLSTTLSASFSHIYFISFYGKENVFMNRFCFLNLINAIYVMVNWE